MGDITHVHTNVLLSICFCSHSGLILKATLSPHTHYSIENFPARKSTYSDVIRTNFPDIPKMCQKRFKIKINYLGVHIGRFWPLLEKKFVQPWTSIWRLRDVVIWTRIIKYFLKWKENNCKLILYIYLDIEVQPNKKISKNWTKISSYQFDTSVGRPTDVFLRTKFFFRGLINLLFYFK